MARKSTSPRFVDPAHVAVRAYFAWLNGGCQHGADVSDWLAAEAAQRRSDAAREGAATRRARASIPADAAAPVPVSWASIEGGGYTAPAAL